MAFAEEFWKLMSEATAVCITSHKSPDDDSIAAMLALYYLATEKFPGKKLSMVYTGEPENGRYKNFANFGQIRFVSDLFDYLKEFDLVIAVDASDWKRLGREMEKQSDFHGKAICIDHHPNGGIGFDLHLVDPTAVSATDIVFRELAGKAEGMNTELVKIFLLGILGDAGNMVFVKPYQGTVFTLVRDLLARLDLSIQQFGMEYNFISQRVFALVTELVANTRFEEAENGWPAYQVSFLPRETVEAGQYADPEVSQARNFYTEKYFPNVEGFRMLLVFVPRSNGDYYVSLRSVVPGVSVRSLAERMGWGGGHDVSAAMTVKADGEKVQLQKVMEQVREWMKQNRPDGGEV